MRIFCCRYTIEYYSPDLQTGWVVAARSVISHTYMVRLIIIIIIIIETLKLHIN